MQRHFTALNNRATGGQGRTTISFFTALTPLTDRTMLSAVSRSSALLAKPDSMTVPLSVATPIEVAATSLFSAKFALILVVIQVSST